MHSVSYLATRRSLQLPNNDRSSFTRSDSAIVSALEDDDTLQYIDSHARFRTVIIVRRKDGQAGSMFVVRSDDREETSMTEGQLRDFVLSNDARLMLEDEGEEEEDGNFGMF